MKATEDGRMEGSKTRARVICNPTSGGGCEPDVIREELEDFGAEWIDTHGAGDAQEAAEEWSDGLLIVVGGDGTVNEVVNGLGKAGFPEGVTLAVRPMGTGNDLAATLAIPNDPEGASDALRRGRVRTFDVARIRSEGVEERFFINVATGGYGAETSGLADEELKSRWGKLAYFRASLEKAREFEVREVKVTLDGEERMLRAVNLAVGNCRYAGGGWLAAPRANPEDGLLDFVVIEDIGLKEALALAPAALAKSDYLDKEGVFSARARKIRVETQPGGLDFTADGEVIGDEPAEFEVIPHTLKVVVGPDYVLEPEE
ncbi:MAG: diacylglycerol kinase family lipid kinase [Actinobacteria bacterium]|nr:diacylglycerol kinase family lipid kinase [Actinomycetota bacterium]